MLRLLQSLGTVDYIDVDTVDENTVARKLSISGQQAGAQADQHCAPGDVHSQSGHPSGD